MAKFGEGVIIGDEPKHEIHSASDSSSAEHQEGELGQLDTRQNPLHRTNTTATGRSHRNTSLSPTSRRYSLSSRRPRRPSTDVGSVLERHTSVRDAASLATLDRPPSDEVKLPAAKIYHPYSFHVLALLMPASMFGVLARLGIQALTNYDEKSFFTLAWVQGMGCLVMGFGVGIREPLGQFYGPLYTALTTGFCGSLTTFSGWQLDVFTSWLNPAHAHRDWLRDVIDGLGKTLFTFAIALCSVTFGAHLASLLRRRVPAQLVRSPTRNVRYFVSILSVLSYAAAYPLYFELSPSFRHKATAALLFSFPGTLTRYLLSINLNPLLSLFPFGTYSANSLGTTLLGIFHVLQGKQNPVSANACGVLQGLADGYCGCLTTVSTFAAEIDALEDWKAWLYAFLSMVTGQALLLVVLGTAYWGSGVSEEMTCAFVTG